MLFSLSAYCWLQIQVEDKPASVAWALGYRSLNQVGGILVCLHNCLLTRNNMPGSYLVYRVPSPDKMDRPSLTSTAHSFQETPCNKNFIRCAAASLEGLGAHLPPSFCGWWSNEDLIIKVLELTVVGKPSTYWQPGPAVVRELYGSRLPAMARRDLVSSPFQEVVEMEQGSQWAPVHQTHSGLSQHVVYRMVYTPISFKHLSDFLPVDKWTYFWNTKLSEGSGMADLLVLTFHASFRHLHASWSSHDFVSPS